MYEDVERTTFRYLMKRLTDVDNVDRSKSTVRARVRSLLQLNRPSLARRSQFTQRSAGRFNQITRFLFRLGQLIAGS
jgi:hypothetical protein